MGAEHNADPNATLCVSRPSSGQDTKVPVLVVQAKPSSAPPNHVLIRVDKFGFSANNITYQALGEHPHFRYFDFHSTPDSANGQISSTTHGLIPVWGFGTVVVSTHPKIKEGERVYGYFAPTRYLLLPVSSDLNKYSFYVPRPHLPADRRPYNQVIRCEADSTYIPTSIAEDLTMLYRPLFWTSYWCEDWLHSSGYRGGVSTILISSASAKTAFCLAYLIRKRLKRGEIGERTKIIGLTSPRNVTFTKQLGLYHDVLEYDGFATASSFQTASQDRWLYVDVAGNNELNKKISAHFASDTPKLVAWISLGLTNLAPSSKDVNSKSWSKNTFETKASPVTQDLKSRSLPEMEQFFMPEWLDIRRFQMPLQEIVQRQHAAWNDLMGDCVNWVELQRAYGPVAVKAAYERLAKEGLGPDKGYVWSLWDEDPSKSHLVSSRL